MLRWKILIAVALYIILAVIAYFNFGFHHLMMERVGGKSTQNKSAWKKLEENIKKNAQPQVLPEFQDSILDEALNQSEQEVNPVRKGEALNPTLNKE
jgi:hypothetical protein